MSDLLFSSYQLGKIEMITEGLALPRSLALEDKVLQDIFQTALHFVLIGRSRFDSEYIVQNGRSNPLFLR